MPIEVALAVATCCLPRPLRVWPICRQGVGALEGGRTIWTERFGGSATKSSEQSEQFGAGASDLACVARRAGGPLLFVCFAVPYLPTL